MADDAYADVGLEEGMSWLPAYILHEACGNFNEEQLGRGARHYHHRRHHHYHDINGSESHLFSPQGNSGKKYNNIRARNGSSNRVSGGPGMQAIFLEAGHKSCGTGVFLPRRTGTHIQPTKKPACSPVLLPSRVVQALNLNVQALGIQMSPRQDKKINQKGRVNDNSVCKKENEDIGEHCYVLSQDRSSPEIFLPKEWSY